MPRLSPFYVYSAAGYTVYINKLAYTKVYTTADNHWVFKPPGSVANVTI